MSAPEKSVLPVIASIEKNRAVLKRIEAQYTQLFGKEEGFDRKDLSTAIVASDLVVRWYTCLETVFLRVSKFFENDLPKERWHQELLEKMTLSLKDVREAVISSETHARLVELLKFRHFQRYYFEIDFDWEKLEFIKKKFLQAVELVDRDLRAFLAFLEKLH
jgi:methionyl-tRNA synthetase